MVQQLSVMKLSQPVRIAPGSGCASCNWYRPKLNGSYILVDSPGVLCFPLAYHYAGQKNFLAISIPYGNKVGKVEGLAACGLNPYVTVAGDTSGTDELIYGLVDVWAAHLAGIWSGSIGIDLFSCYSSSTLFDAVGQSAQAYVRALPPSGGVSADYAIGGQNNFMQTRTAETQCANIMAVAPLVKSLRFYEDGTLV